MKPFRILLAMIIFVSLATAATAAPEIAVDLQAFDFGSIRERKKVDHLFTIRNKGDAPLTIKSVKASCGCTAVSTTSSVIQPGDKGEIKASFNSANFSGTIHKTIAVHTNDPKIPSYTLTITGNVVPEVQLTPNQLNLGQIKSNETKQMVITVANNGTKPLRLIALESPLSQMTATTEKKLLPPRESTSILVSITPRSGDHILSSYLTIKTDNPLKPSILVPIYGSQVN